MPARPILREITELITNEFNFAIDGVPELNATINLGKNVVNNNLLNALKSSAQHNNCTINTSLGSNTIEVIISR